MNMKSKATEQAKSGMCDWYRNAPGETVSDYKENYVYYKQQMKVIDTFKPGTKVKVTTTVYGPCHPYVWQRDKDPEFVYLKDETAEVIDVDSESGNIYFTVKTQSGYTLSGLKTDRVKLLDA